MFVGFIPIVGGLLYVTTWLGLDWAETPLSIGYMIALIIVGCRASLMPCPRCGKPFASTWIYQNPLASRCLHCGLPRGAPCDPDWNGNDAGA